MPDPPVMHLEEPEARIVVDRVVVSTRPSPAMQGSAGSASMDVRASVAQPGSNALGLARVVRPSPLLQKALQSNTSAYASRSNAENIEVSGQRASTSSAKPCGVAQNGTSKGGERRGLFYDDLGAPDRYPSDLMQMNVVIPDVDAMMQSDDYAMQMQVQIEDREHSIIMCDKEGGLFHWGVALGHRDVHRFLAVTLYERLQHDLAANVLPAVETVRFMRIKARPTLQEISTRFGDCHINDFIWSLRKGTDGNDLTRNAILVVVFASPQDARNADVLFRRDVGRWFAKQGATMELMKTSNKNPTGAPNWEYFDLCRRLRLELMKSIFTNRLLSEVRDRMPPTVQKELEEKGAQGQLSMGNCLNKPNNVASTALVVRPPLASQLPLPVTRAVEGPVPLSRAPRVFSEQRVQVLLRPTSRPQADERQAGILRRIISRALHGFFGSFTEEHPCRIWNGNAMLRILSEAVLRHPPIGELIQTTVDAAGDRGQELRRLRDSKDTTILYGTAVVRKLPVFTRPVEYQGGIGIRSKTFKVRTLSNVDLVRDALQSASYVAVSLRENPGFEPAIRLLSLVAEERAFIVDLAECPFEDARVQALLSSLLASQALLCFESKSEVLLFQSLCTAETAVGFEARLYGGGFTGPSKFLEKCPVVPAWQPTDGAMLHQRYRGLEFYAAKYLGALLNTAYDEYLYCASLNEYVYEESVLRAIAMAMLLRRCQTEAPDAWSQMIS